MLVEGILHAAAWAFAIVAWGRRRGARAPITTVEIAEPWRAANVALWSVRRHLMINASAALMLLLSVTIIARRFRSYVAGQGLEQTIEVARTVQRDLLPSAQCELDDFEVAGDCAPLAQVGRRCL